MPRAESRHAVLLALLTASATAALLATGGRSAGQAPALLPDAAAWRGLVESRPRVALGERVIVVLRTPSLAQRVAAAGGEASTGDERAWTNDAVTAQKLLLSRLALRGLKVHPDYSFARVLDGFSATIDASAVPLVERDADVAGVYPVRAAFPASFSTSSAVSGLGSLRVPGIDGRGVTIALLDTGVDSAVPYLRGRVLDGIDVVGRDPGALAAVRPDDPAQVERHGTEMAGILVGAGGPNGLAGVATGASVLPIRVAGWQPDALGRWAVYARSDQIIAGLDRAVDPNDDGDAHDAARVALVALAEPFAGFADAPEARAVSGALALDTLVVAAAGNDGAAGDAYGDVSAPGAAQDALTVGALDARTSYARVQVVVRSGLDTLFRATSALAGVARPTHRLDVRLAAPRGAQLADFFTRTGASLVAGKAALVSTGAAPRLAAERAAAAGASAVLLYGAGDLPAGGLGLDETASVPVLALPAGVARAALARLAAGRSVTVTLGAARVTPNPAQGRVAAFSSAGLAFDGTVKPDVVAPGVGIATADPGANPDGSPSFATVNGSSAAAATVAGAAALLAQARPSLGAQALKGLLVGTAHPLADDPVAAQGAGIVDAGAAVAGELAASPSTLSLRQGSATFTLTNVSTRTVHATVGVSTQHEGAAAIDLSLAPRSVSLAPGGSVLVHVAAVTASPVSGTSTADGAVVVATAGGGGVRIPWSIPFAPSGASLIGAATLSAEQFKASDTAPALLTLGLGSVLEVGGRAEIEPLQQLDIDLARADGKSVGLLARMRDVLPGSYTFGLTGRGPGGRPLSPGRYVVTVVAYPVDAGAPTRRSLSFELG